MLCRVVRSPRERHVLRESHFIPLPVTPTWFDPNAEEMTAAKLLRASRQPMPAVPIVGGSGPDS